MTLESNPASRAWVLPAVCWVPPHPRPSRWSGMHDATLSSIPGRGQQPGVARKVKTFLLRLAGVGNRCLREPPSGAFRHLARLCDLPAGCCGGVGGGGLPFLPAGQGRTGGTLSADHQGGLRLSWEAVRESGLWRRWGRREGPPVRSVSEPQGVGVGHWVGEGAGLLCEGPPRTGLLVGAGRSFVQTGV